MKKSFAAVISRLVIVNLILLSIVGCGKSEKATHEKTHIKFGILPAIQTLPLFVAQEKGYFSQAGLDIELVMFSAATEKDIALSSGAINGAFGDLFTPIVIAANGHNIAIVASNYNTVFDRRMFGIMGKPGGNYKILSDIKGVPVAISSNSVIEFVTESLMKQDGFSEDNISYVEVKNIGLRMQMLMSGQVEAATLSEPLISAAIAGGASLLADDTEMNTSQTVLVFNQKFISANGDAVVGFLTAVNRANEFINEFPNEARSIMIAYIRLPEPLKDKYPVPRFPTLSAPDSTTTMAAANWLSDKNILQNKPTYSDLVNASFLK